eukprot:235990-Amphidinium_carterae.1
MTKGLLAYVPKLRGRNWSWRSLSVKMAHVALDDCQGNLVSNESCSRVKLITVGQLLAELSMAHGIGGRPYPRVEPNVRLYRSLNQDPPWAFFPSEKKQGYFPYSCVRRFIDSSWWYPIMKKIRMAQEREALYELLPETNPDEYPWEDIEDHLVGIENRDPRTGPVERWRWEQYWYDKLQARSFRRSLEYGPLPVCYVCRKTGTWSASLSRCIICDDVFMCREHSIFPACLPVRTPICCLHSRWTRGVGSWNPRGGYPYIPELHRKPLKTP